MAMSKSDQCKKTKAIDVQIGGNLRALRSFANITQAELSEVLDVSFQQLQKYEKGSNRLPIARLYKLQKLFNVPFESFFSGIDSVDIKSMALIQSDSQTLSIYHKIKKIKDDGLKSKIEKIIDILVS